MEVPPVRPKLLGFRGIFMTSYFIDNWDNVQSFQARPDDIVIATYPKAGTTWLSYIMDLLFFDATSSPERKTSMPLHDRVPFLELCIPGMLNGKDMLDELTTSPRLIKTHLPVQLLPPSFWEQKCKIVYLARNAKDSAVSYFHFGRMNNAQPEPGDWSNFLQDFMDGKVVFGSWFDHVNGWWEKKQNYPKLHYMFYEDLIKDSSREIERLCSFLGLSLPAEQKQSIVTRVTFDQMKGNKMTNFTTIPIMNQQVSPFMRKGKVGDWQNHFTVAQNQRFDEYYKQKMKDSELQFRTEV